MDPLIVAALTIAFSAILVMGIAFYYRDDPAWRRDMPRVRSIVLSQIVLVAFLLILSALYPN